MAIELPNEPKEPVVVVKIVPFEDLVHIFVVEIRRRKHFHNLHRPIVQKVDFIRLVSDDRVEILRKLPRNVERVQRLGHLQILVVLENDLFRVELGPDPRVNVVLVNGHELSPRVRLRRRQNADVFSEFLELIHFFRVEPVRVEVKEHFLAFHLGNLLFFENFRQSRVLEIFGEFEGVVQLRVTQIACLRCSRSTWTRSGSCS